MPPPRLEEPPPAKGSCALRRLLAEVGLGIGRSLAAKPGHALLYPSPYFPEATLCTELGDEPWWGSIDLRVDAGDLEQVARRLRRRVYLLANVHGNVGPGQAPKLAVWQSGGPCLAVSARELAHCGLPLRELAALLCVNRNRLTRPAPALIALEARRRYSLFKAVFGPAAKTRGLPAWGYLFHEPLEELRGKTPSEVLREQGSLDPALVCRPEEAIEAWGIRHYRWQRL